MHSQISYVGGHAARKICQKKFELNRLEAKVEYSTRGACGGRARGTGGVSGEGVLERALKWEPKKKRSQLRILKAIVGLQSRKPWPLLPRNHAWLLNLLIAKKVVGAAMNRLCREWSTTRSCCPVVFLFIGFLVKHISTIIPF